MYTNYVKELQNENNWLGSKSMKLLSTIRKFNFYIWTEEEVEVNSSNTLQLIDIKENTSSTVVIHILEIPNSIHFNLLVEKKMNRFKLL